MGSSSGLARRLQAARVVRFRDLTDLRGNIWEPMTDFFFGINQVTFDWSSSGDINRLTKWVYTQDSTDASAGTTGGDVLDIGLTTGPSDFSNQRELWTIPETGTWGIAHAVLEFKGESYSAAIGIKPQKGIGLRAQEDVQRRAVVVWHDSTFGIANAINVGVWQGNLDGTNFTNRQSNATFTPLEQTITMSSASRTGGVVTFVASAAHRLKGGEYVDFLYTREFNGIAISRSGNVVTATVGSGHQFQTGDSVQLKSSSPSSFDGTFTLTGVGGTTVQWSQTGINESGTTNLSDKSSDLTQVQVTDLVDSTTFRYTDGKHALTSLGSTGTGKHVLPYTVEVVAAGTVVFMRCWGQHQTAPAWNDAASGRLMVIDLDKPNRDYTITQRSRTSGVATVTIGAHDAMVGGRVNIAGVTGDTSFETSNGFVTAFTSTTISYVNAGPDVAGTASVGTVTRYGGGAATDIRDISTPRGSGRIAVVAAHMGTSAPAHNTYRSFFGENSQEILLVTQEMSATSDAVAAVTADITIDRGLTATSQAVAEHTADLTVQVAVLQLTATSQAVAEHTASLALALALTATSQAVAEHTADVTVTRGLDAVSQAVAEHTAAVTVDRGLTATSQAVAEHTADLAVAVSLAATSQAVAEHTAALNLDLPLAATSQAVAEHTAELTIQGQVALDAVSQAVSEHTAALTLAVGLTASSQAVAEHMAALNVAVTLTATSQAVAEHTADLTVQVAVLQLDAVSQAVAEHTAVMVVDRGLAATSSSVAEHTATLSLTAGIAGTMQAVAEHTAALTVALALAAVSEAVAGAAATLDVSVFLAGRPTLTAVTDHHTLTATGAQAFPLTAQTDRRTLVAVQE